MGLGKALVGGSIPRCGSLPSGTAAASATLMAGSSSRVEVRRESTASRDVTNVKAAVYTRYGPPEVLHHCGTRVTSLLSDSPRGLGKSAQPLWPGTHIAMGAEFQRNLLSTAWSLSDLT